MNRRSFLKILGAGAGAMATYNLVGDKLFGGSVVTESVDGGPVASQIVDSIEDYRSCDIVQRVPTTKVEKATLLGLKHHLNGTAEVAQLDNFHGHCKPQ